MALDFGKEGLNSCVGEIVITHIKLEFNSIRFSLTSFASRILIFPKGDNVESLSIYLELADSETILPGWSKSVQFYYSLSVINENPQLTVKKEAKNVFYANNKVWGFPTFIPLTKLNYPCNGFLVSDVCTVEAEVRFYIEELDDKKKSEEANKKPTYLKTTSTLSEYDTLFVGIQNLLEGDTFDSDKFISSFSLSSSWSDREITKAKHTWKEYLDLDLDDIIQLEKYFKLKNSFSILLSTNSLGYKEHKVDEVTEFMANFDRNCEQYEIAKEEMKEVKEKEKSIDDLKTSMRQICSDFLRFRKQAEVHDNEIVKLERQLAERKANKERHKKRLEDMAIRVSSLKQALLTTEEDYVKLSVPKKEQAKKVIVDMRNSWKSFKFFEKNIPKMYKENGKCSGKNNRCFWIDGEEFIMAVVA
ncbi:hypothetical protein CsatA_020095 [Cannabis sativa]